jgi:hypothetical protein
MEQTILGALLEKIEATEVRSTCPVGYHMERGLCTRRQFKNDDKEDDQQKSYLARKARDYKKYM